jgi:hypothetical protein
MRSAEIGARALEHLLDRFAFAALSEAERQALNFSEESQYLLPLMRAASALKSAKPASRCERMLLEMMDPAFLRYSLQSIFTPSFVPPALYRIYEVLESSRSVIITFNYDRITDRQSSFRVIDVHGQTSPLIADERSRSPTSALEHLFLSPRFDAHLPLPEDERVRGRSQYTCALKALRQANSVVFVGYGFGGGADALSFEDFSKNINHDARVHVLGPRPDSKDLTRQIGYGLRDRRPGFQVWNQSFRWHALCEAILSSLSKRRVRHVAMLIGQELDVLAEHDRR